MFGERVVVRHRWNIQDYALGRVTRCLVCSAGVKLNEQQRIRVIGGSGGSFTLTFAGQTTASIPFDASPNELQDALENLEVNHPGDIFVSGEGIGSPGLTVEFRGAWSSVETIPNMIYNTSALQPATASIELLQLRSGTGGSNVQERVSSVYKQAGASWCTACYGVGFEGGFEPIIYVTMALITDQQQETTYSKTGAIQREDPTVQFSFEPLVQEFDLMARVYEWESDNITPKKIAGRFVLEEIKPITLRTGPGTPDDSIAVIPEEFRTKYAVPNADWVIGQEGGVDVLPYEHAWNLVPLTRTEETLVEEGILQNRRWYEQAGVSPSLVAKESHP